MTLMSKLLPYVSPPWGKVQFQAPSSERATSRATSAPGSTLPSGFLHCGADDGGRPLTQQWSEALLPSFSTAEGRAATDRGSGSEEKAAHLAAQWVARYRLNQREAVPTTGPTAYP